MAIVPCSNLEPCGLLNPNHNTPPPGRPVPRKYPAVQRRIGIHFRQLRARFPCQRGIPPVSDPRGAVPPPGPPGEPARRHCYLMPSDVTAVKTSKFMVHPKGVRAIEWAVESKVDVISMSWTIDEKPKTSEGQEHPGVRALRTAIDRADGTFTTYFTCCDYSP